MSNDREIKLLEQLTELIELNQKLRDIIDKKNNKIEALTQVIATHGFVVWPDNTIHRADY